MSQAEAGSRIYKVLFDFEGQEDGELSVKRGETVRISKKNGIHNPDPGWTLVEHLSPPFSKGYVPTGYIGPLTAQSSSYSSTVSSTRSPLSHASPVSSGDRSPTKVSKLSNIRRLSDPRLPVHLLETLTMSDSNNDLQGSGNGNNGEGGEENSQVVLTSTSLVKVPSGNPNIDVDKVLYKHDDTFSKIMEARGKQQEVLSGSLTNLEVTINHVRKMNESIQSKLMKLDNDLENERQKWKQKVDADNLELNRRVSQLYA